MGYERCRSVTPMAFLGAFAALIRLVVEKCDIL